VWDAPADSLWMNASTRSMRARTIRRLRIGPAGSGGACAVDDDDGAAGLVPGAGEFAAYELFVAPVSGAGDEDPVGVGAPTAGAHAIPPTSKTPCAKRFLATSW
jgi:hypothetical protein